MKLSLSQLSEGASATLRTIHGGQQVRGRLAAMGLLPGTQLEVVQNSGHGPFVVSVRGCRIVIGRGMASRLEVE